MTPAPALVLFDIDGTLLRRAGPHHREALVEAVRRVTGLESSTDHIPVHGMLDQDILTRMMLDAGASAAEAAAAMPDVMRNAQSIYVRRCPDLRRKTCPHVRAVLRRLQRRGAVMGLVTGNLTRIGWKKMERAGLREFFAMGSFAETAQDRAGLARNAIAEARRRGWILHETPVSLIGDAPSDILAAKANGIRAVAVQTGISTREELAAHAPELLLEDLRSLRLAMLM